MAAWGPAPAPMRRPVGGRVSPGVLLGVSLWRILIIAFALIGLVSAVKRSSWHDAYPALSQQASLATAVVYALLLVYPLFTAGRRHEPDAPWLRGATAVLMAMVSVTFMTMLSGNLNRTWSLFEHLLTPLAVVLDWLVVGRAQRNARWWFPFTWLAGPLAYLIFYIDYANSHGPIYDFLDPKKSDFPGVVAGFSAGAVVFGFVLYGIGKIKGAIAEGAQPRPLTAPYPGPGLVQGRPPFVPVPPPPPASPPWAYPPPGAPQPPPYRPPYPPPGPPQGPGPWSQPPPGGRPR